MPRVRAGGDVVLDTHVVVWWQASSDRLSRQAQAAIDTASRLLISPISFWEIAMLVAKGRIELDRPTSVWVGDFLTTQRVEIAELTPDVAVTAGELDEFHGDPADRVIVASAVRRGATLVSKDRRIRDYGRRSPPDLTVLW
jgi:PIN domain nuclease of toxin-antitoxin system